MANFTVKICPQNNDFFLLTLWSKLQGGFALDLSKLVMGMDKVM
tara:strand:+ start:3194 stop:3325 length:132 start_codon:yes stop_codon:yes gene_type:complete